FENPTVARMAKRTDSSRCQDSTLPSDPKCESRNTQITLSFAQQRIWFLCQLEPDNVVYNHPVVLRLTGQLRLEILESCLNEIVARHDVLRTTFSTIDGDPVQVISPQVTTGLSVIDLRYLPDTEREAEALRRAAAQSQQPFDFVGGPLLRTTLFQLSDQNYLLLFLTHHIVFDGWSDTILLDEIPVLSKALCDDDHPALCDLPIRYADYALWQRTEHQDFAFERDLFYWKRQLDNAPPLLNLPTDRPRPSVQTYRGMRHTFTLS